MKSRERFLKKLREKGRIVLLWLGLAQLLGLVLFKVLDYMNHPGDTSAGSTGGP
jgi:hypothetical protein